jgi:hypothetical protein
VYEFPIKPNTEEWWQFETVPNPVDDVLTVDIDAFVQQFASGAQRYTTTFDIRLYNYNGVVVRQATSKGSNVTLNVSNLMVSISSIFTMIQVINRKNRQL